MQTFLANPQSLAAIRELVRAWAIEAALDERIAGDAVLAASEASTNAVLHSGGALVHVEVTVLASCIRITVQDDGIFDRWVSSAHDDRGGRGLQIIMALMDEVTLTEGSREHPGTRVTMTKCVPQTAIRA
jgi:anti-sigma regulatory factor (Ser/Thr protein kinase)